MALAPGFHSITSPRRGGFTLIELVLVIAIVGMIAGIFVRYFDESTRVFQMVDARRELTMEARQALLRMDREIRQVRSANDLLVADATHLSFYGVDNNRYTLSYSGAPGGALDFQRGAVTVQIAAGIDSLNFSYLKNNGTPAVPVLSPGATDVYRVHIFLRLARGREKVSFRTGTYLRNLQ